jgi:peptide deformylase
MAVQDILLLGNPLLAHVCRAVEERETGALATLVTDLHDTLIDFRSRRGYGRAIAGPQIGALVRVVYIHIDAPCPMLNPVLEPLGEDTMDIWDDCLSFPNILVKVRRFRRCRVTYRDLAWHEHVMTLEGDLSELLQHECDHLDGVLAVQRAFDARPCAAIRNGRSPAFLPAEDRTSDLPPV